ncbi:MAG: hypothetical protein AAFY55_09995 [Bacteroidota bacterium]
MSRTLLRLALVAVIAVGLAACDSTDSDGPGTTAGTLNLAFSGLDPLANGFHYEGWVMIDGAPVTTGKFNVSDSGGLVTLQGAAIANGAFEVDRLDDAAAFVLTIEPAGDTDAVPAATKLIGGDFGGASAALSTAHPATLGSDFASVAGQYIIATPTSAAMDDEASGIWFLDVASGGPVAGLDLPTLPEGWAYEGWVVLNGSPLSTGTFLDAAMADVAAPFSGAQPGPPFPGEDFLVNAPAGQAFPTDLAGATVVISVEPSPDDSPAPFAAKPLLGTVSTPAAAGALGQNLGSLPTGTARR